MTAYEKKMNKIIIKAKHDMLAVKETIEMEKESLKQNLRENTHPTITVSKPIWSSKRRAKR